MAYEDSDFYSSSEKKWRKYKRESNAIKSSSNPLDPSLMRSFSHKNMTSSKSPPFLRSFSQKSSANKTSTSSSLCRSSSVRSSSVRSSCPSSPSHKNNKSALMRNLSKKSSAFGKKCTNLAKEQKARFYIMKRCVSMLVSWRKHGDS